MHREVREAYRAAGMLYELQLDLLYQCDLDCEHCYLDDKKRRVLPTTFWQGVLDQAAELGVFSVTFSGGEILLRKDLMTLVAHARARGMFVHLKSHAGHIDDRRAQAIADAGVSSVSVSYYASDPEVHDAITRRPGSHAATLLAMKRLRRLGVTVIASCIVMKRNRDAYREVIDECDALGIPVRLNGEVMVAHSGDRFPREVALDVAELAEVEAVKREQLGEVAPITGSAAQPQWEEGKNCVAGSLALYICPEGKVTPCVAWQMPLGDLSAGDTLQGIWQHSGPLHAIQRHRRAEREVCARCEVRDDCEFCMGQAYTESGDPNRAIETLCLTTRARSLARARAEGRPDPPMPAGLKPGARQARFPILDKAQAASLRR